MARASKFLAGAAFAGDQNRFIGLSEAVQQGRNPAHCRAVADDRRLVLSGVRRFGPGGPGRVLLDLVAVVWSFWQLVLPG